MQKIKPIQSKQVKLLKENFITQVHNVSPVQLGDYIFKKIKEEINQLKDNFQPKEPEELLTRNEVADLFKIDLSSVHNWTKKGKLKSYGISGSARVYYKRSEINKLLIQINKEQ